MPKNTTPPVCEWCGAKLRGRSECPRGPRCSAEQAEHEALSKRIAKEKK